PLPEVEPAAPAGDVTLAARVHAYAGALDAGGDADTRLREVEAERTETKRLTEKPAHHIPFLPQPLELADGQVPLHASSTTRLSPTVASPPGHPTGSCSRAPPQLIGPNVVAHGL